MCFVKSFDSRYSTITIDYFTGCFTIVPKVVKCGNKSGCRIDLHFMVFAAVSIWCQMQPDLLLFNIMFPDTQVPLVSQVPQLSQVPQVPLVPLESTLLTRSVHHHACSMSTTTSTSFVTNFLMAGKSLIVISFTISFG